ncbi:protein phosphatase 2C domain-containing protein [Nocardioides sp. AE5]|uniref:PP2C family protein-serine/threonine phosphatase n=1 Tax=Nocardioides sp. AE5 TaxID=2962573 RepID=UPI002882060F|nr:protein phosphatase 2C domain-containing protein [Nocardioides sp. AE5]MDT0200345.1 protein phosphatase 2C domain-containing protein [Nocardioides sp. AE5]
MIRFEVAHGASSDPGAVREENQDAWLSDPPVFVVADGMGGHSSGRVAADLVTQACAETDWGPWASSGAVVAASQRAFDLVGQFAAKGPGAPGSTMVGVGLADHGERPSWLVFNVGDSRCYLLRGETLAQVSVDHSEEQQLLDQGMAREDVRQRSRPHVITRAVGAGLRRAPEVDQWLVPAQPEDRILLCSDGLYGELSDPLITALLMAYPDPAEAAAELVGAAVRCGGRDNVTALVVDAVVVAGPGMSSGDPVDDTVEGDDLSGDTLPRRDPVIR